MNIFLDDERFPEQVAEYTNNLIYNEKWIIVRNYEEFIRAYRDHQENVIRISFDHDLGEDVAKTLRKWGHSKKKAREYKKLSKSGMDCAKWLIEYVQEHNLPVPIIYVHSQNPVGKENIISLFRSYQKHRT